ncbi:MAG: polysaccharide pyruvyl transferase family protein [Phycisphaerae bacterium]|nr:polysaccharide pyruvyl transferase family protein [Tepidisphaeraceae bacterium]
MSLSRRSLLAASLSAALLPLAARSADKRPPRILLRSSWQTVNIGDIAHTPGVLALLEKHLPDVEIWLWPSNVDNGVDQILARRFPKVKILKPTEYKSAMTECDFLLHSSGPSLVAEKHVAQWAAETRKPYGVYGITFSSTKPETIELLTNAKFVFFRDGVSLAFAREHGVKCPIMEFGPDGAFATDIRNDAAADAFLKASGLEEGKFLCAIPRYRTTPYWQIHGKEKTATDEKNWKHSQEMKEHDNAPIRKAIEEVLRNTDMKVLVCPEDRSQVALGKEILVDPLPADVKNRVVWRDKYWITDEALSTYLKSAGLFGLEMHSPIMCIGHGVPAIVCRFKQQTSKGTMWRDIGLSDWLFDLDDEAQIPGIVPAIVAMAKDPAAAKAKATKAREFVLKRQKETMEIVGKFARRSA